MGKVYLATKSINSFNMKRSISFKLVFFNAACFLLIVYFIYHIISGQRGVLAYLRLQNELVTTLEQYNSLRDERLELERNVSKLHPSTIDLDLLDEVARQNLGLIGETERVIFLNDKK